jgi:hypothetical protein
VRRHRRKTRLATLEFGLLNEACELRSLWEARRLSRGRHAALRRIISIPASGGDLGPGESERKVK